MASTKKSKKKNVKVRSTPTTQKKSQSFSLSNSTAAKKSQTRKHPPQSMLPLEPIIRRKKHPPTVKATPTASTVTTNNKKSTLSKRTMKRSPTGCNRRDTPPERIAMYLQLQEREYASSLQTLQPSSTIACQKRKRPSTTTTTKQSAIQLQPATFSATPTTLQMIQQTTESFQNHAFVVDATTTHDNHNNSGGVPVQRLARQLISLGTTETAKSMFQSNDLNDNNEQPSERGTKRRKLSMPNNKNNNHNNPFDCLQEIYDDHDDQEKKPFFDFLPATTLAPLPVTHDAPTVSTNKNESTDPLPPRPNNVTNQFGFAFQPPTWSVINHTTNTSQAPSPLDTTTVPTTIDDATPSTIVSSSSSPSLSLTPKQNSFHHTDPDIDPDL